MWTRRQPRRRRAAALAVAVALALTAAVAGCGDGKLDPSFGGDGRVTLDVGSGHFEFPTDLAIDPQGRIVITGWLIGPGSSGFVARLLPDGTPDPDFNNGLPEIVHPQGSSSYVFQSVAIDAEGRIVLAGSEVVRLLPDGQPDPLFSGDGRATLDYDSGMSAVAVTLDDQGRIVVAGSSGPTPSEFAAARLLANGSPDPTFAGGGIANPHVPWDVAGADAVAVDGAGRIVLAGRVSDQYTSSAWEAIRLVSDGSVDQSFGAGGRFELPRQGQGDNLKDMTLDRDGRIVLAGSLIAATPWGGALIRVVRLLPSGALDPAFGEDGRAFAPNYAHHSDFAEAVAIDPAGRVIAAGASYGGGSSALLARFTESGAIDRAFGAGGIIRVDYTPTGGTAAGLGIDDKGRYVIAGQSSDGVAALVGVARFTIEYPACAAVRAGWRGNAASSEVAGSAC
jgi:uncharacterized delta-60 repeat protein